MHLDDFCLDHQNPNKQRTHSCKELWIPARKTTPEPISLHRNRRHRRAQRSKAEQAAPSRRLPSSKGVARGGPECVRTAFNTWVLQPLGGERGASAVDQKEEVRALFKPPGSAFLQVRHPYVPPGPPVITLVNASSQCYPLSGPSSCPPLSISNATSLAWAPHHPLGLLGLIPLTSLELSCPHWGDSGCKSPSAGLGGSSLKPSGANSARWAALSLPALLSLKGRERRGR